MRWSCFILVVALASTARADDVAKRPVPDYDGRGEPATTAGDVLIWVPRVAASPLYLVSEYVVRRPVGFLVMTAEKNRWPQRLRDYFNGPFGVVPTVHVDLGFRPTGGFYLFWNGAGTPRNHIRATASFSSGVVTTTVLDRLNLGDNLQLLLRGHFSQRSDQLFYGIGPESRDDDKSRFELRKLEGSFGAQVFFGTLSRFRLEAGMRSVDYVNSGCCDDPTIVESVEAGLFPLPPGYAEGGYTGPFTRARLTLDSRSRAPGTGVALTLDGEQGSDTSTDRVWVRAGATLSGSVDLTGRQRVLSLILAGTIAEPVSGEDVPFTELATLGVGGAALSAFRPGRLYDRSAVSATLQYEWPVWAYLVGVVHVGTGNVFGKHFEDLELGKMRGSAGIGFRSAGLGDHRFEMAIALGTDPFDDGGGIDSVRFVFGGVTGF